MSTASLKYTEDFDGDDSIEFNDVPYEDWKVFVDLESAYVEFNVFKSLKLENHDVEVVKSFLYKIDKYFIFSKLSTDDSLMAFFKLLDYGISNTFLGDTYIYNYYMLRLSKNPEILFDRFSFNSVIENVLPMVLDKSVFGDDFDLELVSFLNRKSSVLTESQTFDLHSICVRLFKNGYNMNALNVGLYSMLFDKYTNSNETLMLDHISNMDFNDLLFLFDVIDTAHSEKLEEFFYIKKMKKCLDSQLSIIFESNSGITEDQFLQVFRISQSLNLKNTNILNSLLNIIADNSFVSPKALLKLSVLTNLPQVSLEKKNKNLLKSNFLISIAKNDLNVVFTDMLDIIYAYKNFRIYDVFTLKNILMSSHSLMTRLNGRESYLLMLNLLRLPLQILPSSDQSMLVNNINNFTHSELSAFLREVNRSSVLYTVVLKRLKILLPGESVSTLLSSLKYLPKSRITDESYVVDVIDKLVDEDSLKTFSFLQKLALYEKSVQLSVLFPDSSIRKSVDLLFDLLITESENFTSSNRVRILYGLMILQDKDFKKYITIIKGRDRDSLINIDELSLYEISMLYRAYQYFGVKIPKDLYDIFYQRNNAGTYEYKNERVLYDFIVSNLGGFIESTKRNVLSRKTCGYEMDIVVTGLNGVRVNVEFDGTGHNGIIDASRDEVLKRKYISTSGRDGVADVIRIKSFNFDSETEQILDTRAFRESIQQLKNLLI